MGNENTTSYLSQGKRCGKSFLAEVKKESDLDAGKRVLVVTNESATLFFRKKHLTLIESIKVGDIGGSRG